MSDETLPPCRVLGFSGPTLPGHLFLGACDVCREGVYAARPTVIDSSGEPPTYTFVHYACAPSEPSANRCAHCHAPATCLGAYEGETVNSYACDECCKHGCEDGSCIPV